MSSSDDFKNMLLYRIEKIVSKSKLDENFGAFADMLMAYCDSYVEHETVSVHTECDMVDFVFGRSHLFVSCVDDVWVVEHYVVSGESDPDSTQLEYMFIGDIARSHKYHVDRKSIEMFFPSELFDCLKFASDYMLFITDPNSLGDDVDARFVAA